MKKKTTTFRFINKNLLGLALLELRLWHISEDKYTVVSDKLANSLATKDNNVIDVILESFSSNAYIAETE